MAENTLEVSGFKTSILKKSLNLQDLEPILKGGAVKIEERISQEVEAKKTAERKAKLAGIKMLP